MKLIPADLQVILSLLEKLKSDKRPVWGSMSAQSMIEHLTDTLKISSGELQLPLSIPAEKVDKAQAFIRSRKPMPKNFQVVFGNKDLRNENIALAIDEFAVAWIHYQDFFSEQADAKTCHPYFGNLDVKHWTKLHRKHISHHLEQFGLWP